jgi:hypothetical protein
MDRSVTFAPCIRLVTPPYALAEREKREIVGLEVMMFVLFVVYSVYSCSFLVAKRILSL